jgi:hypothetical protein
LSMTRSTGSSRPSPTIIFPANSFIVESRVHAVPDAILLWLQHF